MTITVSAKMRQSSGRTGARQQRLVGRVPAIIYGNCDPITVSCSARDLATQMQDEAFRSTLLTIDIEGKKISALLREVQRHPYRRDILHVDFQAVSADKEIAANVPVHFINVEESPGIKLHHAIFTSIENQLAVHCLPADLPEFIVVDAGNLDINKSIHLSEITPPPGVRFDAVTRGEDPALAIMTGQTEEMDTEDAEAPEAIAETEADTASSE